MLLQRRQSVAREALQRGVLAFVRVVPVKRDRIAMRVGLCLQ